jgi:cell wall assembly regulator SMI1
MEEQERKRLLAQAFANTNPQITVRLRSKNTPQVPLAERWSQFLHALTVYSSHLAERFGPGASEQMIHETEQRLHMTFPQELHSFYQLQNGSGGALFDNWSFLSLQEACDDWEQMKAHSQNCTTSG